MFIIAILFFVIINSTLVFPVFLKKHVSSVNVILKGKVYLYAFLKTFFFFFLQLKSKGSSVVLDPIDFRSMDKN